ncbi:chemotaxis protein CheR [Chroococcidiopsis sp. FACHB-1243]|uniref:CheR family methyltransferase n=1 Tax=Chroococcidiopsis sp. [FACHB-1243] TaxID=2692781 RepID=UPI001785EA84|nr:CheR family methyltransferase [Chroococcidiopsis sp. [FACHB-1243]]MBD2309372.1 chemotaxis protein CheR [Chroococcidiopsis sp. [FACHB-1243]]
MNLLPAEPEFEALLDYLKHDRGCDLTGYKRSSLMRRFRQQMQSIDVGSYQDYLKYLQRHDEEWMALLDTVLINVTGFFRDRDAWDYLESEIIPKIIGSKQPDEQIRVWSAGCAAGHEVYSLLMLFAEALGIEACLQRVQFYATDVDEAAIEQARLATYDSKEVTSIPPQLLEKYFEPTSGGYVFHRQLRRQIVFGYHNLVVNAPMSKIDLLSCRNVLIYFNGETQASIFVRFHFALKNTGFLFLGKSETLVNHRQIFTPISLKHHLYAKGLNLELNDHLSINPKSSKERVIDPTTSQIQFWQTAYETNHEAQLAVDYNGRLVATNNQANILFGLTLNDWDRPFEELEIRKLVGSQASLQTFYRNRRRVTLKNIEWNTSKGTSYFDISIVPVFSQKKHLLGVNLTFIDVSDR